MRKNKAKKMAIAMMSCCAVACLSIGTIAARLSNFKHCLFGNDLLDTL